MLVILRNLQAQIVAEFSIPPDEHENLEDSSGVTYNGIRYRYAGMRRGKLLFTQNAEDFPLREDWLVEDEGGK